MQHKPNRMFDQSTENMLGPVNTIIKNPDMVSFICAKIKGKSVYPDQILPFFAARKRHDIEFRSHQRSVICG